MNKVVKYISKFIYKIYFFYVTCRKIYWWFNTYRFLLWLCYAVVVGVAAVVYREMRPEILKYVLKSNFIRVTILIKKMLFCGCDQNYLHLEAYMLKKNYRFNLIGGTNANTKASTSFYVLWLLFPSFPDIRVLSTTNLQWIYILIEAHIICFE